MRKLIAIVALALCFVTSALAGDHFIDLKDASGTGTFVRNVKVYIDEGNDNWMLIYENNWTGQIGLTDQAVGKRIKLVYTKNNRAYTKYHRVTSAAFQDVRVD